MRRIAALVSLVVALAVAEPAAASVRLARLTSPVSRGSYAALIVRVAPKRVICSITVLYKSGPSHARGLKRKRPTSAGLVRWSWKVGTRTTRGRWPIIVRCGRAGALRTAFVVR